MPGGCTFQQGVHIFTLAPSHQPMYGGRLLGDGLGGGGDAVLGKTVAGDGDGGGDGLGGRDGDGGADEENIQLPAALSPPQAAQSQEHRERVVPAG